MSEILTFALPVVAAVVYSLAIYLKKVAGDGQVFEPAKFGATLLYGIILGGIALFTGVQVTDGNIGVLYAAYTGVLVLLENAIKAIFRTAQNQVGSAGLSQYGEAIPDGESLGPRGKKLTLQSISFILAGVPPAEQPSIIQQISAAEAQGLPHYYVKWSGGVFMVYYGQMYGSELTLAYKDIPIVPALGGI